MKNIILCIFIVSLCCSGLLQAQYREKLDAQSKSNLKIRKQDQLYRVDSRFYSYLGLNLEKHSLENTDKDTVNKTTAYKDSVYIDTVKNKYGDLRNDKVEFNKQYPLWSVALKVTGANVVTFLVDRYFFNYDFSRVGFNSWNHNIKTGWEWDQDRFGMNFIVHPYSGSTFFNAARSSGYNYWESIPFAALGSLEWEYFGENTLPAYNDIVNTTIDGVFIGEVMYRIGSDILDDRTTGFDRFFREFSVAVLSPTRAFSRFTQGKMFRVTSEEVYQTEPLNVTLTFGRRQVNEGSNFLTGPTNWLLDIMLDYGNPFEVRSRKPFDYFKVRVDITKGPGRKILDNVIGYGFLFGSNSHSYGWLDMLLGGFQHFDYYDNLTFELATIAFGPGIITKLKVSPNSNLYTNFHVAIVPLAGNSTHFPISDTSQARDYNFGGGAESKLECTLQLGSWVSFKLLGSYYWIRTYVGYAGDHYIGILKPSIGVRLFDKLSIGVEHLVYYSDRYTRDYGNFHDVRTEQRIQLTYYFENFKQEKK
ncbi:MAG: DUF3943 domain-containing protein [Ignavibacteriales bacterium]|nr:DUF3943 domain-containing protein [Ignavibacteriales bacterium]